MDTLKSLLPPGKGVLPYYMLILSFLAIGNSIQTYATLHFSRRIYNGRFIRNPRLNAEPGKADAEDMTDKLVPAPVSNKSASDQVTPLASRLFGTWTLISSIVRCYAAYNLHLGPVYNIAIWTYVVVLAHMSSELFIYKTMTFGLPQFFPFFFAGGGLVYMCSPMTRQFYVKIN